MIKKCKVIGIGSAAGKSIEIALTSNLWLGEGIKRTISKSIFHRLLNITLGNSDFSS
jgi:hypothetical protein